jgi:hypothetical protein
LDQGWHRSVAVSQQYGLGSADIPNFSARAIGMLKMIEVFEGRWDVLVR